MKGVVAVCLASHEPFEFREYPVPDPAPDAIVVRMRVANICGSDLHLWRGEAVRLKKGLPQILGHEMVGTIEKLGSDVTCDSSGSPISEGDRIIYTYSRPCGTCRYCLTREACCPNRNRHWLGVSSDTPPHFNGAYGEFYYLARGHDVFRVPEELSDDLVSPVNCAAAEVLSGLRRVAVHSGETVLVQGAGGLGLYAIAMAREMGATRIIVLDGLLRRLELAGRFGADHLLNINEMTPQDRQEQILQWTGGLGADLALELTGAAAAVAEGVTLLRDGGRYLWAGNINKGLETSFDPSYVVRKSLVIKGIHGYESWAIPQAMSFLSRTKDRYPYESILSHHFQFSKINEAFALADRSEAIRVSISF